MIFGTEEEALICIKKWQRILRLQDWVVTVHILPTNKMPEDETQGTAYMITRQKAAVISLLASSDYERTAHSVEDFPQDHEATVIHELLHLFFTEHKAHNYDDVSLESAINCIAGGLLDLDRQKGGR